MRPVTKHICDLVTAKGPGEAAQWESSCHTSRRTWVWVLNIHIKSRHMSIIPVLGNWRQDLQLSYPSQVGKLQVQWAESVCLNGKHMRNGTCICPLVSTHHVHTHTRTPVHTHAQNHMWTYTIPKQTNQGRAQNQMLWRAVRQACPIHYCNL